MSGGDDEWLELIGNCCRLWKMFDTGHAARSVERWRSERDEEEGQKGCENPRERLSHSNR